MKIGLAKNSIFSNCTQIPEVWAERITSGQGSYSKNVKVLLHPQTV